MSDPLTPMGRDPLTPMTGDPLAHIVDDDEAVRDALAWLLRSRTIASRGWDSAESFLAAWTPATTGCLILDIRMAGISGLELFDRLRALGCPMPVIFLTGHADVPAAIAALRHGAFDFFEKPFNDNDLADRVQAALDLARRQNALTGRLTELTAREQEIMRLILEGKMNKVIAAELGITMRTVEVHRARIFEKMGVKTAVELARLLPGKGG